MYFRDCKTLSVFERIIPLTFSLEFRFHQENGGVARNLESGPPKDHFNSNFRAKDLDVIFIS
jgi:hypothetical protein